MPMRTMDDFLRQASKGGQVRSGIVLGIRMAMAGLQELEIADPRALRRHLITIVETDRCLPDAIELVTGCRLGNRTLKFKDLGKMAATFVDLRTMGAMRLAARESANLRAEDSYPWLGREQALTKAYLEMPLQELFSCQMATASIPEEEIPGYWAPRAICAACGESVSFGKHVQGAGGDFCRSCARTDYFDPFPSSVGLDKAVHVTPGEFLGGSVRLSARSVATQAPESQTG